MILKKKKYTQAHKLFFYARGLLAKFVTPPNGKQFIFPQVDILDSVYKKNQQSFGISPWEGKFFY